MQLVAGAGERRRQAELRIAPGVAVGVVREQAGDDLVGRRAVPQREERRDHVLQAPEEEVGPGEALLGIALAAEEVRLPRAIGADAGNLVDLRLVGHRIGGVGRAGGDEEVDLVAQDQFGGDLGGAAAGRLAVLGHDLDLIVAPADLETLLQDAAHLVDDEIVGLAEAGERAGARADVPDLDDAGLPAGGPRTEQRRSRDGGSAALHQRATIDAVSCRTHVAPPEAPIADRALADFEILQGFDRSSLKLTRRAANRNAPSRSLCKWLNLAAF